ncbi:MAG TPA: TonB-dependent receptor [Candidatus Acidoferrales bacterium]|jgi:vitamin B12 transporter|nr:TonB-dependent receptor [Candidatus Acidoferrales bacterium]
MRFSVRVSFFVLLAAYLLIIFSSPALFAQSQLANISGTITDPHGAAVPEAQVSARSVSSANNAAQTISANDGRFSLTIAPGRYRVKITRDSFAAVEQDVDLNAGENRAIEIRLALEPLSAKVVVTAQALPLDADSSPAPLTILTRETIGQRVATSLPDLLVSQPGFSLGRTGAEGGSASLFLDGGNSNYTKVLVDGVPANTPGGLIDYSNFTLENIDKIEIVHGAESALYGSDAMDGVIQIFTHRGTTRVPEFTAYADGGNFSTGHGGAELSGILGRFDYSAAVSDMQTSGQGPNDAFRNRTLSGNFGWRLSDTARIGLSIRDNDSAAGTPGQTLLFPANVTDSISLQNFNAGLHVDFETGTHWRSQLSGSESYFREFNFDPFFPTFYQYNRADLAGQTTYLFKAFAVTAGYEYEIENGILSTASDEGLSLTEIHARRNNQAGFLDARWKLLTRLTVNAGARVEDNAAFGAHVLPRVGASYVLRMANGAIGDTRLLATYGHGIVEPRFDQSYGTDPCFPGNPQLLPDESRTIHAGLEQKLASDRVHISADYFDNRFHNIVSFLSVAPSAECLAAGAPFGAGTFFNTDLARARGGNFSGEARITHWLSSSANYTYDSTRTLSAPTDIANIDPNYLVGSRLLRRPVNSGSVSLNANYWRMNWNISGYFSGQRFDYNYPGQIIDPGYALINLAATYNIRSGFSIYGRINNLANKQYEEAYGFPALGREFRIGVKYTTRHE